MSDSLDAIDKLNESIQSSDFKHAGIFTNSLLKTRDTTQLIRDIRDEEVVFFQGKQRFEIDYELINNLSDKNNDLFLEHEFKKILEEENGLDSELNYKLNSIIPKNLNNDDNYKDDILKLKDIYKRTHKIKKVWASANANMLDQETSQILKHLNDKLDTIFNLLAEISSCQNLIRSQKEQLSSME